MLALLWTDCQRRHFLMARPNKTDKQLFIYWPGLTPVGFPLVC